MRLTAVCALLLCPDADCARNYHLFPSKKKAPVDVEFGLHRSA
jgi:hypothetical protein